MDQPRIILRIQELVAAESYRFGRHARAHMKAEGFEDQHVLEALRGRPRVLEEYPDEARCLLLEHFHFSAQLVSMLHILCELEESRVHFVTAYIPEKPWWVSPTRRGRSR